MTIVKTEGGYRDIQGPTGARIKVAEARAALDQVLEALTEMEGSEGSLDALVAEIAAWQAKTFPGTMTPGALAHLASEVGELLAAVGGAEDIERLVTYLRAGAKKKPGPVRGELADVVFLVIQTATCLKVPIADAAREKLVENRKRTWKRADGNGVVEHVPLPNKSSHVTTTGERPPLALPDQPPPVRGSDAPPTWEYVLSTFDDCAHAEQWPIPVVLRVAIQMKERDALGRQRYGMPLRPFDGRSTYVDVLQEALDLCAYLGKHSQEKNLEYALARKTGADEETINQAEGEAQKAKALLRRALRFTFELHREISPETTSVSNRS